MKILSALPSESFTTYREWEVVIRRCNEAHWDLSAMKKRVRTRASQLKVPEYFSQEYQNETKVNRAMVALNTTQAKELQEIERCKSQGYNTKAEPTGQLSPLTQ